MRASWEFKDDAKYRQRLPGLAANTCYDGGIWVRRKSSATGTFTLSVGGVDVTQNIALLTNDTWTLVALPLNEDNWEQAIGGDKYFAIAVTSLATGTLQVDAAFFRPMVEVNGIMMGAEPDSTAITSDYERTFDATFPDQGLVQQHILIGFKAVAGRDAFLNAASSPTVDESGI